MNISRKKSSILLFFIILFSIVFRSIPFFKSNFRPYSWDALSVVYGSDKLLNDGKLHPDLIQQSGYSPIEYINREPYYPVSQIILIILNNIFTILNIKINLYNLIVFFSIFLNSLLILIFYKNIKRIYYNDELSILGAFFLSFCPTITRDVLWSTIFTLLAYNILFASLYFMILYHQNNDKKNLIPIPIFLFLLYRIHFLTFTIFFSSLLFFILLEKKEIIKQKIIFIIFFFLTLFISIFIIKPDLINNIILHFYLGTTYYMNYNVAKYVHPIWNSIHIFGYPQFILGILGLLSMNNKKIKNFIISFLVIPIIFSSSHLLGFNYFGQRFTIYAWIPLHFAIPNGFLYVNNMIKKVRYGSLNQILILIILLSSLLNGYIYQTEFAYAWEPSLPSQLDYDAIKWISTINIEKHTILTTNYWPLVATKWIPVITGFNTTFLNIDSILKYENYSLQTYPQKGVIGSIAKLMVSKDIIQEYDLTIKHFYKIGFNQMGYDTFMMFKYPDSNISINLMKKYDIYYIYTYRGTPEDISILNSSNYLIIYSNEEVNIYERIY
jgi:hypothetical protein